MLLLQFVFFSSLLFQLVSANTEKLIFTAKKTDKPCTARSNVFHLSPPYSEVQNNLIPDTITTQLYLLDKLNVDESYELRISYPAITPTDFNMTLLDSCVDLQTNTLASLVSIQGKYTGVSHIKGMESRPVTYNIVLETLYFGFLFYNVYKIVVAIAIALLLGQFVAIPIVRNLIHDITSHDKVQ